MSYDQLILLSCHTMWGDGQFVYSKSYCLLTSLWLIPQLFTSTYSAVDSLMQIFDIIMMGSLCFIYFRIIIVCCTKCWVRACCVSFTITRTNVSQTACWTASHSSPHWWLAPTYLFILFCLWQGLVVPHALLTQPITLISLP